MNDTEVARLKAVLPNHLYYSNGMPNRVQGIYCSEEHDLLQRIYGSPDVQTVLQGILNRERSTGRDEGRQQVYRQMAEAIGLDTQMKNLRDEMEELKQQLADVAQTVKG